MSSLSFGVVGIPRVCPGGPRVNIGWLDSFGYALASIGFIRCVLDYAGASWVSFGSLSSP